MKKMLYEKPMITDERNFEVQAMACLKTPGWGSSNLTYCGPVWTGMTGNGRNSNGCIMNPETRSS